MTIQIQKSKRGYVNPEASTEGISAIEYVAIMTDGQGRRFATTTALTLPSLLKRMNKELLKAHDYENKWKSDESRGSSRVEE